VPGLFAAGPADVFHLIRAGVTGGKTVPESVAENPLVFATLTAPSFGHVHSAQACGRPVRGTRHCRHAHTLHCLVRHGNDDPELGQPLCFDCYDYTSQVVWQWWAPDLWRRFTIALRRLIAKTLGVPAIAQRTWRPCSTRRWPSTSAAASSISTP